MDRPRTLFWQDLTRAEIAAVRDTGRAVVAVPVGAIEQHAAHLPVDTDARLSASITRLAAERSGVPVLIGPTLPFGFSPHHLSLPGTISLRLATYFAVLGDVAASIVDSGFRRVVFVNGHGGNSAPLRATVAQLVTDGLPVSAVDYWGPAEDAWIAELTGATRRFGHACEFETSLMMAVKADDPREVERILGLIQGLPARTVQPWMAGGTDDPMTAHRAAWPPIFQADDCGYFGDPAAATPELGRKMLTILSDGLARFFEAFAAASLRVGVARDKDRPSISRPLVH